MTEKSPAQVQQDCINRFIALANTLREEGVEPTTVSGCLMSASGVYATFLYAGNEGGLTESGVDKVATAYRQELERIQRVKRQAAGQ